MKTYKHLFCKVIDHDNLLLAIKQASLGKRDRPYVKRIIEDPEPTIKELQELLVSHKYSVPYIHKKYINDGIQKKRRKIVTPSFKEQIVHHAIMQVAMPIFQHGMYEYSCGSIPLRGATYGKEYIEKFIRKHPKDCKYFMKIDIHHFFQSINHDVIKEMLARKIKDGDMLWLINVLIDSYHDDETGEGLPIGYYTSQWLSNWYLQGLDHYIKEECRAKCYVRYMDDMVAFASNKRILHELVRKISEYIKPLGLVLKPNWQVAKFDYNGKYRFLDFMGFRFYRNRTTLRRSIYLRICRKLNRIGTIRKFNWYTCCQVISYLGYIRNSNCYNVWLRFGKGVLNPKYMKQVLSRHQRRLNEIRIPNETAICGA